MKKCYCLSLFLILIISCSFFLPEETAPPAPLGLSVVGNPTQTEIILTWYPTDTATGYRFYIYDPLTLSFNPAAGEDMAAATIKQVRDLDAGMTYYFAVSAYNSIGESAKSSLVSADTAAAEPGVVSDNVNPKVLKTYPVQGATGIPRNAVIAASFNETMSSDSINESTFLVYRTSDNVSHSGRVWYAPEFRTAYYEPLTSFSANTSYTVRITTSIKDSTGMPLGSERTFSFRTTSVTGSFIPPVRLENILGYNCSNPLIGFDSAGDAHVVFLVNGVIHTLRYLSGEWSETVSLSESPAEVPVLAVGYDGSAVLCWIMTDGDANRVWASEFDGIQLNAEWTSPHYVDEKLGPGLNSSSLTLVYDAENNAFQAAWHQWDGTRHNIWVSRYESGAWSTPANLSQSSTYTSNIFPRLSANEKGQILAAWQQVEDVDQYIEYGYGANYYPRKAVHAFCTDGVWNSAQIISGIAGAYYSWPFSYVDPIPVPVISANGKAMIIHGANGSNDMRASYFNGTTWGTDTLIENLAYPVVSNGIVTSVSDTLYHALWIGHDYDASNYRLFFNRYNGTSWLTDPLLVDNRDQSGENVNIFDFVSFSDGKASAAWTQYHDGKYNLYAGFYNGTSWGSPIPIEDWNGQIGYLDMAQDNAGAVHIVWTQHDGDSDSLFWTVYNP